MYRDEFHLAGGSSGIPGDSGLSDAPAVKSPLIPRASFQQRLNDLFKKDEMDRQDARSAMRGIFQESLSLLEDILEKVLEDLKASEQHENLDTVQDLIKSTDPDLPAQLLRTKSLSQLHLPDHGLLPNHEHWDLWCAPIDDAFVQLVSHGEAGRAHAMLENRLNGQSTPTNHPPERTLAPEERAALTLQRKKTPDWFSWLP